jgi:hypothetical protein
MQIWWFPIGAAFSFRHRWHFMCAGGTNTIRFDLEQRRIRPDELRHHGSLGPRLRCDGDRRARFALHSSYAATGWHYGVILALVAAVKFTGWYPDRRRAVSSP